MRPSVEGNVGDEGVEVGKKGGWWVVPFLFCESRGLGWVPSFLHVADYTLKCI